MIRDKNDDENKAENRCAGDRAAARGQIQRGSAECYGRPERDDRENAGQCRDRDRMGKAGDDVGYSDQRPFPQPDQHQAVYGREHRLDHGTAAPLPIRAEQPVADAQQLPAEEHSVAEQEEQGQKSEAEDDQTVNDFGAVEPGRCSDRSRVDLSQQLLSRIGVAEIGAPRLLGGSADNRQLRNPFRHRNTVALGLTEIVDDNANLARAFDRDIDERDGENEPDRESNQQRRKDAGLAAGKSGSDPGRRKSPRARRRARRPRSKRSISWGGAGVCSTELYPSGDTRPIRAKD